MGKEILIVDDALFMRKMIRRALEAAGHTDILEAPDGETAVSLYKEKRPRLMMLDITMPGKSGMEVLEEIIAFDPRARIVMCSAVGQESVIQRAVMNGAADFIVKPFKADELVRIVEYNLSNCTEAEEK